MITPDVKQHFFDLIDEGKGTPRDVEALKIIVDVVADFLNDVERCATALEEIARGKQ